MKTFKSLTAAALATAGVVATQPALAEISANVALTSNYVWRGVTQNAEDPAIQGGFDYAADNGIYVGVWGSSVDFGGPESTEIDLYAGWSTEFSSGFGLDLGVAEYTYHGSDGASDANFTEFYVGGSYAGFGLTYYIGDEFDDNIEASYSHEFGPVALAATYGDYDAYAYYSLGISGEVGGVGLDLTFWDTDEDDSDSQVSFTISKSF